MMSDRMSVRKDGHVAWLTFNRPDKLNAMTIESWGEFDEHLIALDRDREIRCLILQSEGTSFLAGHDLGEIQKINEDLLSGDLTGATLREWKKNLQNSTRVLRSARFPVVAAVQGYAVGAGCELVFSCDLVVAGADAQFGFPEASIGATITNGGTFYLPRKIGLAKARELAYTGEFIDAEEAHRLGLVNRVVPAGEERAGAEALARRIASRSPISVQLHKAMIDAAQGSSLEASMQYEIESVVAAHMTKDTHEGALAFFEKREPVFKGE